MRRYATLAVVCAGLGYGAHWYQSPKADPAPAPAPAPVDPAPPLPDPGLSARLDGIDQRIDSLVPELAATVKGLTDLQGKVVALPGESLQNKVSALETKLAALPADRSGEALRRIDAIEQGNAILSRVVGGYVADLDALRDTQKAARSDLDALGARVPKLRPGESFLIRSPYAER